MPKTKFTVEFDAATASIVVTEEVADGSASYSLKGQTKYQLLQGLWFRDRRGVSFSTEIEILLGLFSIFEKDVKET